MSIDNSASALQEALRAFGEALGRSLAEGITRGVQEGLSRSLDLDTLTDRLPRRAAEGVAAGLTGGRARRGGRPRGEARACNVAGCPDPARSRGLCSRHYQQELRREKGGEEPLVAAPAPQLPVMAKPPLVRKKLEVAEVPPAGAAATEPREPVVAPPVEQRAEEPREKASDVARRIFGVGLPAASGGRSPF